MKLAYREQKRKENSALAVELLISISVPLPCCWPDSSEGFLDRQKYWIYKINFPVPVSDKFETAQRRLSARFDVCSALNNYNET